MDKYVFSMSNALYSGWACGLQARAGALCLAVTTQPTTSPAKTGGLTPTMLALCGIGVSPGVAVGEVVVFAREGAPVPDRVIREQDVPNEIARFEEALIKTRHQISGIQRKVSSALGEENASIFDAHLLVVDDRYFVEKVIHGLRDKRRNVEVVLKEVADRYIEMLSGVEDDYLRERAADVRDVTLRINKNLVGERMDRMDQLERPCIV